MASRTIKLLVVLGLFALTFSIAGPQVATSPVAAQRGLALPAYRALVQAADQASWADPGRSAPGAHVAALVQLDLPPLAVVGHEWSHARRLEYARQVAAEQRRVAAEVQALGGTVLAGFTHAAAGLAVAVEAAAAPALRDLPGVAAVVQVSDYAVDQGAPGPATATLAGLSALIGADAVRELGNDGAGIDIAIVDSGVDYTHVKLGGSGSLADYQRAACGAAGLAPGQSGCDPSRPPPPDLFPNSKVRGGFDYLGDVWPNPDPRCGALGVCIFFDENPIDLAGHGTSVADIMTGLATQAGGADSGVAPGANLWVYKACNGDAGLCNGVALLRALDAALDLDGSDRGLCTPGVTPGCRAYDPADIINLSVSFSYGQPEDALVLFADIASYYGSLVVASAGNDGDRPFIVGSPAAAAAVLAVAESALPGATGDERIAASASRGPRIADNGAKPDLAAPGAIASARAGSGTEVAPFSGASGSAPVAAGVAALIIQQLERLGVIDANPGLADAPQLPLSLAPLVKSVLMNSGTSLLSADGAGPAPITLQGSGRLNALAAFRGRTLAWDATAMAELLAAEPALQGCTITPLIDLLNYLFFRTPPPCASGYPFGNRLFRAWNAQAGSVSFGYQPVAVPQTLQRQVVVVNYARSPRSYTLGTSLRFAEDIGRGVSLSVSPASLYLPGNSSAVVTVTATIDPQRLRPWTLNGGALGATGSASCPSEQPEIDCPSLTLFEVDGALAIDGGANNRVSVPIHLLPRRVAEVSVSRVLEQRLLLANPAPFTPGLVEPFALVDVSPNTCDRLDDVPCESLDYIVGARPGSGQSPVDLRFVGLRSYSVPGLNASLGLPAAPTGALPDEVVEFALTVYDRPFRASPNVPLRFEVYIDANRDGVSDYVVANADLGGGRDGRNAVFVRAAGTPGPGRSYFFTAADFNTQNWVLPVPAAAVGLRSDQPFNFYVRALDAFFQSDGVPQLWDCSPAPAPTCGATAHTMQTGQLRFRPDARELSVPAGGSALLGFSEDAGGVTGSPAQTGLLLLFRDALPERGSDAVILR